MPKGVYFRTLENRKNLSLSLKGRDVWNKGLNIETSDILRKQGIKHSRRMKGRINIIAIRAMAKYNRGKHRSVETKNKISLSHKGMKKPRISKLLSSRTGTKHPGWLGGTTPEYIKHLNGSYWKNIRKNALKRDNYTCQRCGKKSDTLDVHHIYSWRDTKENKLNNLISLCRPCHRKEDIELHKKFKKNK